MIALNYPVIPNLKKSLEEFNNNGMPNSLKTLERVLCLPMHAHLGLKKLNHVICKASL
ncbi:MAG: dTDP-4-amino-4,6-dideoxygalactose transaminase [Psychroserpens sp.]|jgi:dTDP-4-amino-4,6-dideoxygalactose transaminase